MNLEDRGLIWEWSLAQNWTGHQKSSFLYGASRMRKKNCWFKVFFTSFKNVFFTSFKNNSLELFSNEQFIFIIWKIHISIETISNTSPLKYLKSPLTKIQLNTLAKVYLDKYKTPISSTLSSFFKINESILEIER